MQESFGTVLAPIINSLREGKNRNRPENEVQEESLVLLANQSLLDSSSNFTNIKSATISPLDTKLYALEEDGRILVYEPRLTAFKERGTRPSEDTYIDILPEVHRVDYGEEIDLWTWFRVPTVRVSDVVIKRVDPAGTEEYLQSDMSLGQLLYMNSKVLMQKESSLKNLGKTFLFQLPLISLVNGISTARQICQV